MDYKIIENKDVSGTEIYFWSFPWHDVIASLRGDWRKRHAKKRCWYKWKGDASTITRMIDTVNQTDPFPEWREPDGVQLMKTLEKMVETMQNTQEKVKKIENAGKKIEKLKAKYSMGTKEVLENLKSDIDFEVGAVADTILDELDKEECLKSWVLPADIKDYIYDTVKAVVYTAQETVGRVIEEKL